MKPLANHTRMAMIRPTTNRRLEPPGMVGPLPGPPPKRLPPRPGLRPKSAPRRLLKSRQTSSRSGGPSPRSGRRGGSEPCPLLLPRPQPGYLRLYILDIKRIVPCDFTVFHNGLADSLQAFARLRAQ